MKRYEFEDVICSRKQAQTYQQITRLRMVFRLHVLELIVKVVAWSMGYVGGGGAGGEGREKRGASIIRCFSFLNCKLVSSQLNML